MLPLKQMEESLAGDAWYGPAGREAVGWRETYLHRERPREVAQWTQRFAQVCSSLLRDGKGGWLGVQ